MKKIALFYTPPIEIIEDYTRIFLELIEENLFLKNEIKIIFCKGKIGLNKCVANYRGDRSKCFLCKRGLNYIKDKYSKNSNIEFISYSEKPIKNDVLDVININDLQKTDYKGVNIGFAVHSSAITTFRDHIYNIESRRNFIFDNLKSSIKTVDILLKIKPDHVYTFNGRVSHYNVIKNFAEHANVDFSIFEISANKNKYKLLKNKPLHSIDTYSNQIEETWNKSSLTIKEKEIESKSFFDINSGREKNKNFKINVFSKDEINKNKKIENLNLSNKRVVSIFNSSRNEFECVEGWNEDKFHEDDEYLIDEICQYFKNNKEFMFVLRVHPNLKYLKNTQNKNIRKLINNENLIIINAEEKFSSYELVRMSETIITFGSTIGVESTYMGKKSITIGDSLYGGQNCTYKPKSFDELIDLIKKEDLVPKPINSTHKFGFYILNNGI
ncbi:hypothetical protein N8479_09575, partial [Flavobacteriaceae bacterium]|nr:hypothetical protein [Flavobacteriaceae bacterium]